MFNANPRRLFISLTRKKSLHALPESNNAEQKSCVNLSFLQQHMELSLLSMTL